MEEMCDGLLPTFVGRFGLPLGIGTRVAAYTGPSSTRREGRVVHVGCPSFEVDVDRPEDPLYHAPQVMIRYDDDLSTECFPSEWVADDPEAECPHVCWDLEAVAEVTALGDGCVAGVG